MNTEQGFHPEDPTPEVAPPSEAEQAHADLETIDKLMDDNRDTLSPLGMKALNEARKFLEGYLP